MDLAEARLVGVAGVQLYANGAVSVNGATDADGYGADAADELDRGHGRGHDVADLLLDLEIDAAVQLRVSGAAAVAVGDPDAAGTAEVQAVSLGTATDGTFTFSWDGHQTAPIDFDAPAAKVQAALETLPNLRGGRRDGGAATPAVPTT